MSAVHFGFVSNPIKLVMLNANGFNAYSYKSILTPLGFHAVALDMRGHGMSNLPINIDALKNWNIFRDDVVEFFDRYIKSPVILAGHSYGAVTGILAMPEIKNKSLSSIVLRRLLTGIKRGVRSEIFQMTRYQTTSLEA